MKIVMHERDGKQVRVRFRPKEEIISTINVIGNKLKDSLKVKSGMQSEMIITMNKNSDNLPKDSVKFNKIFQDLPGEGDHIFNLLVGVDSLQDTLRLAEIDSAYRNALKDEK
ncbi:MAG: hypothetical protein IPI68_08140 [Chitinophagaceae bacterium]|nr:hypothetical protein [Chitinophagaceae bacterium]